MSTQSEELRQKIWALPQKTRRRHITELAHSLEYYSLTCARLPADLFSIYVDVLSDSSLCSRPGIDGFVSGLFSDFHKLSDEQRKLLSVLFLKNGVLYSDPVLRITVSDFIARKYSHEIALDIFSKMWITGNENLRDMACFGAQVLSLIVPKTGDVRNALRQFGQLMD
jgi:hypothetical protein